VSIERTFMAEAERVEQNIEILNLL